MSDKSGARGETDAGAKNTLSGLDARLVTLRADDSQRRVALVGALSVGLAATTVHWIGLFVAGALVGLTRRSLPRALAAGLGFGVLVLVAFFVVTPLVTPGSLPVLAPLSYVTVGLALIGPVWGALVRGVA